MTVRAQHLKAKKPTTIVKSRVGACVALNIYEQMRSKKALCDRFECQKSGRCADLSIWSPFHGAYRAVCPMNGTKRSCRTNVRGEVLEKNRRWDGDLSLTLETSGTEPRRRFMKWTMLKGRADGWNSLIWHTSSHYNSIGQL